MLRKKQILSNKKEISRLFSKGFKSSCFPIVMFSMPSEKDQVLFSVSKKKHFKSI
jgi:ribonuclease P protein component